MRVFPLFALLALLLCACVPAGASFVVYSDVPPPEPYVEITPMAPSGDHVWVDGYWHWDGREHVWINGYWAMRPYPDYVWAPSGWVWYDGRYRFYSGRWVHQGRTTHVTYVHTRPARRVGTRYRTEPVRRVRRRSR